jgi:hypothetical protein
LRHLGVLHPEFDEEDVLGSLMADKRLFFEVTGSVTSHRQACIDRVNREILALGMHAVFELCRVFSFSSPDGERRGAYSLHPPQSEHWPCCSPMRIYRALAIDHNLPVLTRHFSQSPIEDVCFLLNGHRSLLQLYDMFHDRALLADFIGDRLRTYNQIAIARNDQCVAHIAAISGGDEPAAPRHDANESERTGFGTVPARRDALVPAR